MYLKHFIFKVENGVKTILFNRPSKKNAFSSEMFSSIPSLLNEAAKDSNVKIVVLSGIGEYFSSGNDFSNFSNDLMGDGESMGTAVKESTDRFHDFISTFIEFPKPLVAIVNGPAIGVAVTMLGLCDLVLASDKATFKTPFTALGLTPEGCSSYTFPQLMGKANAAEMLVFGKKIDAVEAYRRNLVTEVIPHDDLHKLWDRLSKYAELPMESMISAKALIRRDKDILRKVNREECDQLMKQWDTDDFLNAVMGFIQKKSKL